MSHYFTRETLPGDGWRAYRKTEPTHMRRIDGPFTVETAEGPLHCPDGWLALDSNGDPYPIADSVQTVTYEPVEDRP